MQQVLTVREDFMSALENGKVGTAQLTSGHYLDLFCCV